MSGERQPGLLTTEGIGTHSLHQAGDFADPAFEQAPNRRRGWDRVGEPFAYALRRSPTRWLVAIGGGALLAGGMLWTTGAPIGDAAPGLGSNVAWAALLSALPILILVDAQIHMLPNRVLYPTGLICVVSLSADAVFGTLPTASLFTGLATGVGCAAFAIVVLLLAPAGGFGLGDIRMLALAGLVLGTHSAWLAFVALLLIPPVLALLPALLAAVRGRDTSVAYGPFIAAGIVLGTFAQSALLDILPAPV